MLSLRPKPLPAPMITMFGIAAFSFLRTYHTWILWPFPGNQMQSTTNDAPRPRT